MIKTLMEETLIVVIVMMRSLRIWGYYTDQCLETNIIPHQSSQMMKMVQMKKRKSFLKEKNQLLRKHNQWNYFNITQIVKKKMMKMEINQKKVIRLISKTKKTQVQMLQLQQDQWNPHQNSTGLEQLSREQGTGYSKPLLHTAKCRN